MGFNIMTIINLLRIILRVLREINTDDVRRVLKDQTALDLFAYTLVRCILMLQIAFLTVSVYMCYTILF